MALDTGADVPNRAGIDEDVFFDYNLLVAYVSVGAGVDAHPGVD